jgi:hypothetical protein
MADSCACGDKHLGSIKVHAALAKLTIGEMTLSVQLYEGALKSSRPTNEKTEIIISKLFYFST